MKYDLVKQHKQSDYTFQQKQLFSVVAACSADA